MNWSRRDVCVALPALFASPRLVAGETKTLPSRIYQFDELPVRQAGDISSSGDFGRHDI